MAAITSDTQTLAKYIQRQITRKLEPGETIYAGALVCIKTSTGNAVNGADAVGLVPDGRAEHYASYANGDRYIEVTRGVFQFGNDGTIVQAACGKRCFVLDNHTVTNKATAVNDVPAGYIDEVTSDGVFVSMLQDYGADA